MTITNRNAKGLLRPPVKLTVAATTPKSTRSWTQVRRGFAVRGARARETIYQTPPRMPKA